MLVVFHYDTLHRVKLIVNPNAPHLSGWAIIVLSDPILDRRNCFRCLKHTNFIHTISMCLGDKTISKKETCKQELTYNPGEQKNCIYFILVVMSVSTA